MLSQYILSCSFHDCLVDYTRNSQQEIISNCILLYYCRYLLKLSSLNIEETSSFSCVSYAFKLMERFLPLFEVEERRPNLKRLFIAGQTAF